MSNHSQRCLNLGHRGREGGADLLSWCLWFPDQQWLLGDEIWLTGLQQQDHVAEKELKACVPSGAWLQTDSETQLSPLVRSQKREVRLRLGCRNALRVAQRDIRRRKASFQLERIKKQRLLESQKGLEPSKASCWLQDDCTQKPPYWVPSTDAMLPGPQHRSRLPGCSSLSLRGLCSWYFPQLHRYSQWWSPGIIEVYGLLAQAVFFTSQSFSFSICEMERFAYSSLPDHFFPLLTALLSL